MSIFLFTDFGASDVYVGQVRSVLHQYAPGAAVFDLLHEAPAFNIRAGAHLLAALAGRLPAGSVVMAVVDPGVGSARGAVAVHADGRWFVGPDNGLLSVVSARAADAAAFPIVWRNAALSASFHGRDLFAPVAGMIESGRLDAIDRTRARKLDVEFGGGDLAEIIYLDHYGNAMTGLRAGALGEEDRLITGKHRIGHARVFSEVQPGAAFWYENSIGLIEIAVNAASATVRLDLRIGQPVSTG